MAALKTVLGEQNIHLQILIQLTEQFSAKKFQSRLTILMQKLKVLERKYLKV